MIDDRLKSVNTFLTYQNKRAREAEEYINGISDKERLEKAIAEWWRKYVAEEFGTLDTSRPVPTSEDAYQNPPFIQTMKNSSHFFEDYVLSIRPELREAIIDLLRDPGRMDKIERDAAARLFGRVVALELAKNEPDPNQMELAFLCFEVVTQFLSSFQETFEKTLSEYNKIRDKWIISLYEASLKKDTFSYFARMGDPDYRSMVEFEKAEWRRMSNPFHIWNPQPLFYHDKFISFLPLRILYKFDFNVWIESLEQLPFPRIKKLAIRYSALEQEPQVILKLIRESPLLFDDHGKWVEEMHTAALYGVMAAFTFAEELFKAVSENEPDSLKKLKEQELPEWFHNAFEAVFQRSDGKIISAGFIAWLIREYVSELIREHERGQEGEWSLTECAIDILAKKLAEKCGNWEPMQDAWKFQQESLGHGQEHDPETKRLLELGLPVLQENSMQYCLGAILIDEFLSIQGNEYGTELSAQKLWSWFADLLAKRDPFIEYVCNPHLQGALNWISYNIGRILAQTQDPVKRFSETWKLLQHQRNRMSRQIHSNDFTASYTSQLLIRVSIGAILWTVDNPGKSMEPDSAKSLWFLIFDSAYHIRSIKKIDMNSSALRVLEQCVAVAPLLFREDVEIPIRHIIKYFKTDSKMICSITWLLWKNGLAIERVDSLLSGSGISIGDSLEEEAELAELSEDKEMIPLYQELTPMITHHIETQRY